LGDYDNALNLFDKSLRYDPQNADAWNNLGSVFEGLQDFPKAVDAYRKALEINPFHEDTNYNLSNIQFLIYKNHPEKVDLSDTVRRLQFVLSLNPKNSRITKLLEGIHNTKKSQANQ